MKQSSASGVMSHLCCKELILSEVSLTSYNTWTRAERCNAAPAQLDLDAHVICVGKCASTSHQQACVVHVLCMLYLVMLRHFDGDGFCFMLFQVVMCLEGSKSWRRESVLWVSIRLRHLPSRLSCMAWQTQCVARQKSKSQIVLRTSKPCPAIKHVWIHCRYAAEDPIATSHGLV